MPRTSKYPYANWMAELPDSVRARPLYDLVLPATHNSGASVLIENVELNSNDDSFYNYARTFSFWPGLTDFLKRWTLTQRLSIGKQLKTGVRQLDLRVSEEKGSGRLYVTHTFACQTLGKVCRSIANFLRAHPGEVLIVYVKPDWQHRVAMRPPERGDRVIACLEKHLGEWLVPRPRRTQNLSSRMTLERMVSSGQRALVSYGYMHTEHPGIWAREKQASGVLEAKVSRKFDALAQFLVRLEKEGGRSKDGYILDAIVTPDTATVRDALAAETVAFWNEETSLFKLNREMRARLRHQLPKWDLSRIQAIEGDFVTLGWVKRILECNKWE